MKFSIEKDVRIAAVPAGEFKVILCDDKKKAMGRNRCTGGFFGKYSEDGDSFTLPVGHLVCDYAAGGKWTEFYCRQRGALQGERFRFDCGAWEYGNPLNGKTLSTLVVSDGKASVLDLVHAPELCSYAISGVPVLRNGLTVPTAAVKAQGWDDSSLYATYHIFVGLKERSASTVYAMGLRTTTGNLIRTGEAARKFKALGFRDVIKLDGGGSFYFNAGGNIVSTSENRRICTVLDFGPDSGGNPYAVPSVALRLGSGYLTGVYWLQWELTAHGFPCELDGSFGHKTEQQLRAYQKANGLEADGICGPATRAALLK